MSEIKISLPELEALQAALKDIQIIIGRIRKRRNALVSVRKAKERGSFLGRGKKRDDEQIWKLRERGMSIRSIAKICEVSSTAVHRSLQYRQHRAAES